VRPAAPRHTTFPDHAVVAAPDLLGRDFTAHTLNSSYVGDITYLPIADGTFCYLATVMDLCSRRLSAGPSSLVFWKHEKPPGIREIALEQVF
jgi:transposase InsO family protein